jgi:hypothetical protein
MQALIIVTDFSEKENERVTYFSEIVGYGNRNDIGNGNLQREKNQDRKKSDFLSDEHLSQKLTGRIPDILSCSDNDCHEITRNHRPIFSNGLEKWL